MKWYHDITRMFDNCPLYRPGTLVYVDFKKHVPLCGNASPTCGDASKVINYDNFDLSARTRHGDRPIALILALNNLEIFYHILVEDRKYWIGVEAVTKAEI